MEGNNVQPPAPAGGGKGSGSGGDNSAQGLWGIAAFGLAVAMIVFNNSHLVAKAGFFAKFFAVIVGTIGGYLGVSIGDSIRRFAMPDVVITDGRVSSQVKTKLFWMVGPQLIGLGLGVAIGTAIVLH